METKTISTKPSFDIFKKSCSKDQDFDLLCSIHLSENDHTRILRDILNQEIQGKKMFLESFINKVLQLKIENISNFKCIDQQPAPGNQKNSKGFVDLLISSTDQNIIIENKVCGAPDTPCQLKRYCKAYCSEGQLQKIGLAQDENNKGDIEAIIFYLTCDGQKEPSNESITQEKLKILKDIKWFHAINYEKDILPWLENDVLPNIPYKSDGNMIKGILLYINYLNTLIGRNSYNDSRIWEGCSISDLYKALNDTPNNPNENPDEDDVTYGKYRSSLKFAIEKKLNQIVAHLQKRGFNYPYILHTLYMKKGRSVTPLS